METFKLTKAQRNELEYALQEAHFESLRSGDIELLKTRVKVPFDLLDDVRETVKHRSLMYSKEKEYTGNKARIWRTLRKKFTES